MDLLVDAIKEMVSQFLVDMMGLITDVFTDLLSCNLSLFEELFSVVGSLYQNVIVPMGIALLLMILIWQLFKSMFGKVGINAEEPIELIGRSSICLFFVVASKPVINYILKIAGTPYQWVIGTDIKVQSFSEYVTALEGITAPLGLGTVSIAILMLIMQFVVAWNYFKMLFIIAERYVLLGVFSYTAPLAFATGGSKSTNNILASWSKMFGGQVVLIILNAWCLKMFLSGYGNMMASGYGFTKFFVATLCLVTEFSNMYQNLPEEGLLVQKITVTEVVIEKIPAAGEESQAAEKNENPIDEMNVLPQKGQEEETEGILENQAQEVNIVDAVKQKNPFILLGVGVALIAAIGGLIWSKKR